MEIGVGWENDYFPTVQIIQLATNPVGEITGFLHVSVHFPISSEEREAHEKGQYIDVRMGVKGKSDRV